MWKCWLKLFSFVEYIILTLNCNKNICLVIESPLKGIRMSLVWTSKEVVSHIEKEDMYLSVFNYCICDFPYHCHSFNPYPCRSVADPRPSPLIFIPGWGLKGQKHFFGDLAPLYIKAWICHCRLLPFLFCYSVYYKVSLLFTTVPLFLIPKKTQGTLYQESRSGGLSI